MTLTVIWTIVVIAYGWMNLPRAQQMPNNPQFLSKLSTEATSILSGTDAQAGPGPDALVWSPGWKVERMSNGARLTFPETTTGERVTFVTGEYSRLLNAEVSERGRLYMLELAAVWVLPCMMLLVVGLVTGLIYREHKAGVKEAKVRFGQS